MSKIVFMYHDVYASIPDESGFPGKGESHYKISVNRFESHLKKIRNLINNGRIFEDDIVFTFDDGGGSFYSIIAPLLNKYGFLGHFYVATKYIGQSGFLSDTQIMEIAAMGHVIGTHSDSHPSNILSLKADLRSTEWKGSVMKLTQICSNRINEASIPNGYYSDEDIPLFKSLGLDTIYTSSLGQYKAINGINIIGRFAVTDTMDASVVEKILCSRIYYKKLILKQKALSFAKWLLGANYLKIKAYIRNIQY